MKRRRVLDNIITAICLLLTLVLLLFRQPIKELFHPDYTALIYPTRDYFEVMSQDGPMLLWSDRGVNINNDGNVLADTNGPTIAVITPTEGISMWVDFKGDKFQDALRGAYIDRSNENHGWKYKGQWNNKTICLLTRQLKNPTLVGIPKPICTP